MDESKYKFKFFLDTKELTMTVADFRRIFQLPQATDNNNVGFVDAPTFSQMVPFFLEDLGFSLPLRSPSNFVSKGLSQPWQTLFHDNYHRVENDDLVKNIFNFSKNKEGEGMMIPEWMLMEEMKLTNHYKIYATVFQVDVPMTQFRVTRRPDPETPIPITVKVDITNLNEDTQISIATQRSLEDLESQQNVETIKEHMMDEELEQLLEGTENVDEDEFLEDIFNDQEDPDYD
ncbi:hypothetical protein Tco_1430206 [Tanacetum coccineum]